MTELLDQLKASLADRYQLDRELGRGGMATVYLAQDLRHRRPVALKVLHPHLAMSLGPERFLREIQIAARLQHPHIVPLYDSGQAGDHLFYVMPFIEGESLRQRLERESPLPIEEALKITRAAAAALDYAHRRDIVHRDIKPENVMLHDGEAVVTDFGIAKAVSAAVSDNLTQTGTAIGTPAYMSPEQAEGSEDLDGRSDIYSLGAMLYEMLVGSAPFTGPTLQSIMKKLLTDPVQPLRERRDEVPDWLEQAVVKALEKAPAKRFETATQFSKALDWPSGGSTPAGMPAGSSTGWTSIAVLPFANMSADPENEYFSDGVAEEIINSLNKIEALRVASRTSSFAFKGKSGDITEIGRKLKVQTVLEGGVRKSGDRLRVTAQLINVADGYQLWSERFDRQLEDVFVIQDEIAENIVRALRVVLSETEKRAIEKAPTTNVKAYDYYLRGRQFIHVFSRNGMLNAQRMFERAIETDDKYARAYAGIADCCAFLYMYWDGRKVNLDAAETASQKAIALDPDSAECHASRGFALSLQKKYSEAREEFQIALRLDPRQYEAHYLFARACVQEGKLEEAVEHYLAAAEARPEDYQTLLLVAPVQFGLGRLEDSMRSERRGLELAEAHLELNPDDDRALYLSLGALHLRGETEKAFEWARRALSANGSDPSNLYNVACFYSITGKTDEALECLAKAIENGFGHREWLEHDSDLDNLREDARFKSLLEKL